MPESVVIARPAWLNDVVQRYGEPHAEYLNEPIEFRDRKRRLWVWFSGLPGQDHRVLLDHTVRPGRKYVARVSSPSGLIERVSEQPPTDDEMRALVALGWSGTAPS